jgi:DNA-directed RNA polymerase subunit RPC12/RpoP
MTYKCVECGRTIEKFPEGRARCPYCSARILYKPRREIVHKVKAR